MECARLRGTPAELGRRIGARINFSLPAYFLGYVHAVTPLANSAKHLNAMLSAFLLLVVPMLAGCPSAPLSYTLVRGGAGPVVVPPRTTAAAAAVPGFQTKIRKSRAHPSSEKACDIEEGPIAIHWRGDSAVAQVNSGGSAQSASAGALSLDTLKAVPDFRNALVRIESKGCLRSDEDYRLKQSLTQRLPLPSPLAYELRFGSYDSAGYIDLTSDFRMQITSPLYATNSASPRRSNVGLETTDYSLIPFKSNDHTRIHAAFTIDVFAGKIKPPSENHIQFPQSFGYSRLFLRSEDSGANSVKRAILLSAPDRIKLAATARVQESASDSCSAVADSKVDCIVFPAEFGVNAKLRVMLNGAETFVNVGATLGTLLTKNWTDGIPKALRVQRLFQGRLIPIDFAPATSDTRSLVLMPGDQITW